MDTDNKTDQLLNQLFAEASQTELPDNGFSRRVMRSLPQRERRLTRLWTACCILMAVAVVIASQLWVALFDLSMRMANTILAMQMPTTSQLKSLACIAVAVVLALCAVADAARQKI